MRGVKGVAWKVDLSGFTAFLEHREARGREGAEEVAVAVARTFLPLLPQIRHLKGTLLSFGGDALTVWFPLLPRETFVAFAGFVHRRIQEAPLPLQARQIFQFGSLQVHRLAHADPDQAPFTAYAGPVLRALARREKNTSMGEVWIHHRIPKHTAPAPQPFLPPPWVPVALLDEPSRFQRLTAVFVEMRGLARDRMAQTFHLLTGTLARLEGHLIKGEVSPEGFRWLAVFGFPLPCEDGEERVKELADALCAPHIRLGAASGIAVNLRIGGFVDFMGDCINTAARVAGATPWGEAWITSRDGKRLPLKGKRAGVTVRSVREDPKISHDALPLFGRQNELRILRDFVRRFSGGENLSVSLVGPPGVGKTRLLQAFLEELSLLRIAHSHFRIADRPHPPWSLLRRVLLKEIGREGYVPVRAMRALLADWGIPPGYLPALHAVLNQQEVSREATRLVSGLLERILRSLPRRLWIFEDAQWMDPPSREVLLRLPTLGHGALWVARDTGERIPVDQEIPILPLPEEAMTALVQSVLPEGGPVQEIVARSGGLPLFALEMARAWEEGTDWLTPRLETLIQRRFFRLTPRLQRILQMAAVFGDDMPISLLQTCVPEMTLEDLQELEVRGWYAVHQQKGRFSHDLLREGVYASLLTRNRRRLHARLARLLETRTPDRLEEIATHWREAGQPKKAARFFREAARRAAARGALEEAHLLFEQARHCYPEGDPQRTILQWEDEELRFWRQGNLQNLAAALERLQQARETHRHTHVQVYLALRTAALERELGRRDPGKALEEVAHLIPAMPRDLQGAFYIERAFVHAHVGQYRKALRDFRQACRLTPRDREHILLHMASVLDRLGWRRLAVRLLQQLLTRIPTSRLSLRIHTLNILANLLKEQNPPEARSAYARALELARQYSGPYEQAMLLGNLGSMEELLGNYGVALERYKESVEIFREIGHLRGLAYMLGSMGIVEKSVGDLQASRRHLLQALRLARRLHHHLLIIRYLNALGGWYLLTGNPHRARKLFALALSLHPVPTMRAVISINRALVEIQEGQPERAREHLKEAERLLSDDTAPILKGYLLWTRALCHGLDNDLVGMRTCLDRARERFAQHHHRPGLFYVHAAEHHWFGTVSREELVRELDAMGAGTRGEPGHFLNHPPGRKRSIT